MNESATESQLGSLLDEELTLTRELHRLLCDETEQLSQADASGVRACATQKRQLLGALGTLERRREQLCMAHHCGASGREFRELLGSLGLAHTRAHWQEFFDRLGKCRELNRRNQMLLTLQHSRVVAAIHTVRRPASAAATPPVGLAELRAS